MNVVSRLRNRYRIRSVLSTNRWAIRSDDQCNFLPLRNFSMRDAKAILFTAFALHLWLIWSHSVVA